MAKPLLPQLAGVLIVAVGSLVASSQEPDESPAPAQQFEALLQDFRRASSSQVAPPSGDRLAFVGQAYRLRNQFAVKCVQLAEQHPLDPIALEALSQALWQVNTTPWPVELVGKDEARARAFALLQRDHIQSDKLGAVCERLAFGYCQEYEPFLRAVLEQNPHRAVQAQACLALARLLSHRTQTIEVIAGQPQALQEFKDLFGEKYAEQLLLADPVEVNTRAEVLFERAAEEFGDVHHSGADTVGAKASAGLFELRHLIPGKPAEDIQAEDQDGVPFKLSDYRGKVVLLDFWSQY